MKMDEIFATTHSLPYNVVHGFTMALAVAAVSFPALRLLSHSSLRSSAMAANATAINTGFVLFLSGMLSSIVVGFCTRKLTERGPPKAVQWANAFLLFAGLGLTLGATFHYIKDGNRQLFIQHLRSSLPPEFIGSYPTFIQGQAWFGERTFGLLLPFPKSPALNLEDALRWVADFEPLRLGVIAALFTALCPVGFFCQTVFAEDCIWQQATR